MPCKDNKILEFIQYQKSGKAPFVIYADIKRLLGKIKGCKNHPKNWSTIKVSGHISTTSSFRSMEKFCES